MVTQWNFSGSSLGTAPTELFHSTELEQERSEEATELPGEETFLRREPEGTATEEPQFPSSSGIPNVFLVFSHQWTKVAQIWDFAPVPGSQAEIKGTAASYLAQAMRQPDEVAKYNTSTANRLLDLVSMEYVSTLTTDLRSTVQHLTSRVANLEHRLLSLEKALRVHTVTLNPFSRAGWVLTQPITVCVEQPGPDDFVACLYEGDIYGHGDTIAEAVGDLKELALEQVRHLAEISNQLELSLPLQKQLAYLKTIFKES